MRDYPLVGCGHRGVGVLARDASQCPFQPHPLCDACFATETTFVATLQARGYDPLPKRREQRRKQRRAEQRPLR